MKHLLFLTVAVFVATVVPGAAMISVGSLSPEQAGEKGITMKWRKNGDAGIKVWLEIKEDGIYKEVTYVEFRMQDAEGKHLVSAMLKPNPAHHRPTPGAVSFAFSAAPDQLKNCSFMVVSYGGLRGGVGWILKVTDHIEVPPDGE